jgi:O-antigen ligase
MIAQVLPKETRFDKTHNMPIEILATTGAIGIVFFMGMYLYSYKNMRDLMMDDKINFYSGLSIILALVAYFVQNLFVFDVFEGIIALSFVLAFIAFLKNNKQIDINLNKIPDKIKDLIILISFILITLNIY